MGTTIRKEEREPSPFSSASVSVIDLIIYHLSSLVVSNRESLSHVPLPTNPISFFSTSLPVIWIPDQQLLSWILFSTSTGLAHRAKVSTVQQLVLWLRIILRSNAMPIASFTYKTVNSSSKLSMRCKLLSKKRSTPTSFTLTMTIDSQFTTLSQSYVNFTYNHTLRGWQGYCHCCSLRWTHLLPPFLFC